MNKTYLWLILIIILGCSLRFYQLDAESLWTDEMVSVIHAQKSNVPAIVSSVTETELMPPGYFILLNKWISIFGISEFSLRFIPALADTLSIMLIFLLGKKIFDYKVGLLSASIYATVMLQIVYAQEARPYALFGLLSLLSSYLLILAYQCKHKEKLKYYFWAYLIVILFSLYVNYMAFFMIIIQGIFLFFWSRNNLMNYYLLSLAGALLGFLEGFKIMFIQAGIRHHYLQENLVLRGVPQFFSNFGIFFYLLPLTILIVLLFSFLYFKRISFQNKSLDQYYHLPRMTAITLIILLFAMIMHIIFLDTTLRSFALIRHSFFIIPFFYLFISKIILSLSNNWKKVIIILLLFCFNITLLTIYYTETTKAPWPEIISFLHEGSPPDTLLLFDRSGTNILLFDYYLSKLSLPENNFRILKLTWEDKRQLKKINESLLLEKLNTENYFLVISSRNIKTGDYYIQLLNKKYQLIKSKEFKESRVYYYKVR